MLNQVRRLARRTQQSYEQLSPGQIIAESPWIILSMLTTTPGWAELMQFMNRHPWLMRLLRRGGNLIMMFLPLMVGLGLGLVMVATRFLSSDWAMLVAVGVVGACGVVILDDLKKIFLIAFVVDLALGLDISLMNWPNHSGGPGGILVSLNTLILPIAYALWMLERGQNDRPLYMYMGMLLPSMLYIAFNLISGFFTVHLWLTLMMVVMLVQFVFMYIYIVNNVESWADVKLMMTTLAICLTLQGGLMILQSVSGVEISGPGIKSSAMEVNSESVSGSRVAGTLASANVAGTFTMWMSVLSMAIFFTSGRLAHRYLALIALGIGAVAMIMTFSRGSWVGFALGTMCVTGTALLRGIGQRELRLLAIGGIIAGSFFAGDVITRLTGDDHGSAESRVYQRELAWNIIEEHTFTGIGASNQLFVMPDYLPIELMGEKLYLIHNKYLSIWVETGFFGFFFFTLFLLSIVYTTSTHILKAPDPYVAVILAGFLGATLGHAFHMTSDPFDGRTRIQMLWFAAAMVAVIIRLSETHAHVEDPMRNAFDVRIHDEETDKETTDAALSHTF